VGKCSCRRPAPYQYPDNLPVYCCPDLPSNSHLVALHCVRANPTKTKQAESLRVSRMILRFGQQTGNHRRVLICLDKGSELSEEIRQQISHHCGDGAEILELQRGRIKGRNDAGDCTLAYLGGMATFTGLDDCALHAALMLGRSFPDQPYVYGRNGAPNWPGGRMLVPAMRTYYALRSLDEIYQAVWRTAVRNDQPVEAIVVMPDEHWLATLYRTVMPRLHLESAFKERKGHETITVAGQPQEFTWDFEEDPHMAGLRIIEMQPGDEIPKQQVAQEFGYTGDRAWERNKAKIMGILEPFFEEVPDNNRRLRRRGVPGSVQGDEPLVGA